MIKIDKVNWISRQAEEAEIYLSDGNFNLTCFSQPFKWTSDEDLSLPLYTLNAKDIFLLKEEERFSIEKESDWGGYKLAGKVIDVKEFHIKIGEYIIELDNPLPGDIEKGQYVSFLCDRIDIYQRISQKTS